MLRAAAGEKLSSGFAVFERKRGDEAVPIRNYLSKTAGTKLCWYDWYAKNAIFKEPKRISRRKRLALEIIKIQVMTKLTTLYSKN